MHFPFYLNLGFMKLHPHFVFETLSYFIGFRVYLYTRKRDRIPFHQASWVIVGAILGAALGSKLLFWLEDPSATISRWNDWSYMMGGKTIVGGLLGGLIGVEWMKKAIGVTRSTGDDFVFPLLIGMSIGRVGCFLTGLSDHTHGIPTQWITGVDFGDGIPRHPAQLYEIAFLIILGAVLLLLKSSAARKGKLLPEGFMFQMFMSGYLLFRFFIDFIKPTPHPYFGLNNIQLACIAGIVYYCYLLSRPLRFGVPGERKKPNA